LVSGVQKELRCFLGSEAPGEKRPSDPCDRGAGNPSMRARDGTAEIFIRLPGFSEVFQLTGAQVIVHQNSKVRVTRDETS
jgi:hypothetical protein